MLLFGNIRAKLLSDPTGLKMLDRHQHLKLFSLGSGVFSAVTETLYRTSGVRKNWDRHPCNGGRLLRPYGVIQIQFSSSQKTIFISLLAVIGSFFTQKFRTERPAASKSASSGSSLDCSHQTETHRHGTICGGCASNRLPRISGASNRKSGVHSWCADFLQTKPQYLLGLAFRVNLWYTSCAKVKEVSPPAIRLSPPAPRLANGFSHSPVRTRFILHLHSAKRVLPPSPPLWQTDFPADFYDKNRFPTYCYDKIGLAASSIRTNTSPIRTRSRFKSHHGRCHAALPGKEITNTTSRCAAGAPSWTCRCPILLPGRKRHGNVVVRFKIANASGSARICANR